MVLRFNEYNLKRYVLKKAKETNNPYLASSMSALNILTETYYNKVKTGIVILSKTQAGLALYAILEQLGYKPNTESFLPIFEPEQGIYNISRFNGDNLPFAAGMMFAKKQKSNTRQTKIFCILGEGECEMGITWETYLLINRFHLNNLRVIIDKNNYQAGLHPDEYNAVEIMNLLGFETYVSQKGIFSVETVTRVSTIHNMDFKVYPWEVLYPLMLKEIDAAEAKEARFKKQVEQCKTRTAKFREKMKNTDTLTNSRTHRIKMAKLEKENGKLN